MSDSEILITMSRQVGELTGKLDAHLDNQDKINDALFKLTSKHEALGNKAIGAAAIAATAVAAAIEIFVRMFHNGGGS